MLHKLNKSRFAKILNITLTTQIAVGSIFVSSLTFIFPGKVEAAGIETAVFPSLADTFYTASRPFGGSGDARNMMIGTYTDNTICLPSPNNCPPTFADSKAVMSFGQVTLPAGAIVVETKLELWHYGTNSGSTPFYVALVTSSWNEFDDDWAKRPSYEYNFGEADFDHYNSNSSATYREIRLNNDLINHLQQPDNKGILIRNYNEDARGVVVCSKDKQPSGPCHVGMGPKLIVKYIVNQRPDTPDPIAPTTQTEYSGNCDESANPVSGACRTTTQVTTSAKVNDPDTEATADMKESKFHFTGANTFSTAGIPGDGWTQIDYSGNFNDGLTSWNVISQDQMGAVSNPSETFVFTTDTTPPEVPILTELPEWTAAVEVDNTKQLEIFSDTAVDNVVSADKVGYILQYSTTSDFSGSVFEKPAQYFGITNPRFEIGPLGADVSDSTDDLIDEGTYYVRAKAHDKIIGNNKNISNWSNTVSTTIDAVHPTLNSFSVSETRISPNNSTSVGIKDNTTLTLNYTEKHPQEARIEIYADEAKTQLVKTLTQDISANEGNLDPVELTYTWDGTNQNGEFVNDGSYLLVAKVSDKAGNLNEVETSQVVIVDNNEANIKISWPFNDLWTNATSINFQGEVKSPHDEGQEDQDLEKFEYRNVADGNWNLFTFIDANFFEISQALQAGQNQFGFKTTDLVSNTQEKQWTINRENINPEINNVLPNNLTNNRQPSITFNVADPDLIGDRSQTSDIPIEKSTGVSANPKDMKVWLTYFVLDLENPYPNPIKEVNKPLIDAGINHDTALVSDLTCVPAAGAVSNTKNQLVSTNSANCSLQFVSELQPDTTYKINIEAKDNAGNTVTKTQNFSLDSHIYSELNAPVDGGVYSTSNVLFTGKASKDSTLTIQNNALNETRSFTLNEFLDDTGADNFLVSNFQIICDEFIDVDVRPETPAEEVCSWEVRVAQDYFNQDKDLLNQNIIFVSDAAGNSKAHEVNLTVNLYKFNLEVSADLRFFSPNGDGRQDGVKFSHAATNETDPLNPPQIAKWTLNITDATNQANVIRTYSGTDFVPPFTQFDGKTFDPKFPNNFSKMLWVADGEYKYYLQVETTDGAVVSTTSQSIFAKTVLSNEIVITNPIDGFVTTEGVVTIQGQAPTDQSQDNAGLLHGEVTVKICVDTLTTPNDVSCDYWVEVKADQNGFFSSPVVLPRINGMTQTIHAVTAVATDEYGNQTDKSNIVNITLDTVNPFNSVSIVPTLTGITSVEDYQKFLNGEISINDIRSAKLISNVSQNTEQVQLSFAEYTNLIEKPANVAYNYLALINNATETNPQLNPTNNSNIKHNYNLPIGDSGVPVVNCDNAAGCVWEYQLPIKPTYGGIYEIEFKGLKGDTVQTMTAGFKVDASIPVAPVFMIVEKWDEDLNNWIQIDNVNLSHFTEGGLLRFRGAAQPGTYLELTSNDVVLASVTVPETGVWEIIIDLNQYLNVPGNGNGQGNGLECREWKQGTGNERKCIEGDFNFGLIGWEIDENGNHVNPVESDGNIDLTYDEVPPAATLIDRSTPEKTIKGWVKTGDQVTYSIEANEKLDFSYVKKEDGFVKMLSNTFEATRWVGTINVDAVKGSKVDEGYYEPLIGLEDMSGNVAKYYSGLWQTYTFGDFRLYVDNTKPDATAIDKSNWSTTWEQGGVNADGSNPELGRTNPQYVTKADHVTLKGKAEKNQRVELWVGNQFKNFIEVTDQNCVKTNVADADKITDDGLTVKYAEKCDWSYDFYFTDDGANTWEGVPYNGYVLQVRTIDMAANVSDFSVQEIVYHDTQKPFEPQFYNLKSPSYDPVPDWIAVTTNQNSSPITKDLSVTVKSFAERFADMQYQLINPKGIVTNYDVFANSTTRELDKDFALGTQKDERAGCMQTVNSRRIGICEDGSYTLNLALTDAAGNKSDMQTMSFERDTVAPATPTVSASKHGDILQETLGVTIKGEPNTKANILITNNIGQTFVIIGTLDGNGNYSTTNLIGKLLCGNREYKVSVKLTDRALNTGESSMPATIKTSECPSCGFSSGTFVKPIHNNNAYIAYPFSYSQQYFNGTRWHSGVDFNGVGQGEAIYAAAPGIVKNVRYSITCSYSTDSGCQVYGYGNFVTIDHGNNVISEYGHLMYEQPNKAWVQVGDFVTPDTQIGRLGNTGFSTGPHLHLTVKVRGVHVDPEMYLGKEVTNLSDEQFVAYCKVPSGAGSSDDAWGGKTAKDLPQAQVSFDIEKNLDDGTYKGTNIKYNIPAPQITKIETVNEKINVYGIAVHKDYEAKFKVNYKEVDPYSCYGIFTCYETKFEETYEFMDKIGGAGVRIHENEGFPLNVDGDQEVGWVENNSPYGQWQIQFNLDDGKSKNLNVGDTIYAKSVIWDTAYYTANNIALQTNWTKGGDAISDKSNEVKIPKNQYVVDDIKYFRVNDGDGALNNKDGSTHIMVVKPTAENIDFKVTLGVSNELKANADGTVTVNYAPKDFKQLVSDKDINVKLDGKLPFAAINTDFIGGVAPLGLTYSRGLLIKDRNHDWDGSNLAIGDKGTATIQKDARGTGQNGENLNYNVTGGKGTFYKNGEFIDVCTIPKEMVDGACSYNTRRSFVAITEKGYLIFGVNNNWGPNPGELSTTEIEKVVKRVAEDNSLGKPTYGLFFDGGGSPSMMYNSDIKVVNHNYMGGVLLIYKD